MAAISSISGLTANLQVAHQSSSCLNDGRIICGLGRATKLSKKELTVGLSAVGQQSLNLLLVSKSLQRRKTAGSRGVARAALAVTETSTAEVVEKLSADLSGASPFRIMDKALETYGDDVAIAFSGAEDVALIEYAKLTGRPFRVFSLDTGRLNAETYQFFDKVEKHYGIHIEYMFPDAAQVEALVREKGMFSFYVDDHKECCGIRKVQPLKRALRGLRAWITGVRKDQSPGTRASIPVVQVDPAFEGLDGGAGSLVKFNPVADVSSLEVWDFLRSQEVPTNELHAKGFISIGCEPCTKTVLPNQHEREGRWWWEEATAKECGLHRAPPSDSDASGENGSAAAGSGSAVDDARSGGASSRDLFLDPTVATLSRGKMEELIAAPRGDSWLVVLYAPWCPHCQAMEEAFDEVARQLAVSDDGVKVGKFRADGEEKEFSKANFKLASFPTILFLPKGSTQTVKRISERRDVFSLLSWVKGLK
eukprot:TRINITY_DN23190_c0_g1_i1.p1 TRINITY_DN23190_c0_g1~~TRINITY_DN23190_c0_g1_i1.p1  ORF type:complete len:479 (+),score=85.06 TRINITY_DN23190_c0_g1_i1:80-1516(+)